MAKIIVKNTEIVFYKNEQEDYISLTDIAKVRDKENPSQIISLWLRTYNTIEYLGLWEMLNNPSFNPHIYEGFKKESATINELICLSNMKNLNAVFINEGLTQRERLIKLNQIAIQQMRVLMEVEGKKMLK